MQARPQLVIKPTIIFKLSKLLTKNRVNMNDTNRITEPAKATARHPTLSIVKQTIGLKNKGTDCIRPDVINMND